MKHSDSGKIMAKVFSFENAFEEIENVTMIKVKSKDYNFMILEDFLPMIGQVSGNVTIISQNGTKQYQDIEAVYVHRKNQFSLLINEDPYVR